MQTRIRELRKLRGFTLKQLAEKVGTTPQTIQRLETANMTVSTNWLQKIAGALRVEPTDLISSSGARDIPFLGRVGQNGAVYRGSVETSLFNLDIPAEDPVAVRLDYAAGRYEAGSILIGSKLRDMDYVNANGLDCLVGLTSSIVLLRRVLHLQGGALIFAPLDPGTGAEVSSGLSWVARIVMSIRYY